eukprot:Blabericola_migrator_1__10984@NODE_6369_length_548_cov_153_457380_g4323_i0_p1_GENE_NODE_6369_length_548_cov_153_457380_g4323_i0NODE_6369_length_548_cov_153_457380_g4323_i0_p1_ORF_typecomplete_len122_score17_17Methyltransf_23/PF13489_6/0_038MTS/PF05175_14/0_074DUF1269/PF06897_12/0_14Methyltransf_31/PF13847_6/0_21SpoU_sub_bind/PF08032_12/0_39_NODE_6369_length_548_cov_153_457380_g4323_i063428
MLSSSIRYRCKSLFDVILPLQPYVPSEELPQEPLDKAWAGGLDGMEVTWRFIKQLSDVLAPGGVCLLVRMAGVTFKWLNCLRSFWKEGTKPVSLSKLWRILGIEWSNCLKRKFLMSYCMYI